MKDMEGTELEIGQNVIHCYKDGNSACMERGVVCGFTAKRVKIEARRWSSGEDTVNCHPNKVIVIGDTYV